VLANTYSVLTSSHVVCRKAQEEFMRNTVREASGARKRGSQINPLGGVSASDMLAAAKVLAPSLQFKPAVLMLQKFSCVSMAGV